MSTGVVTGTDEVVAGMVVVTRAVVVVAMVVVLDSEVGTVVEAFGLLPPPQPAANNVMAKRNVREGFRCIPAAWQSLAGRSTAAGRCDDLMNPPT